MENTNGKAVVNHFINAWFSLVTEAQSSTKSFFVLLVKTKLIIS